MIRLPDGRDPMEAGHHGRTIPMNPEAPETRRDFLAELKRRRVVRAALVRGAAAFAVLQVADIVVEAPGLTCVNRRRQAMRLTAANRATQLMRAVRP